MVGRPVEPGALLQGQTVTVPITALAAGGDGIARLTDGRVLFVAGVVPGDTVEARLVHLKKDHAFGRILQIVQASPHRIEAPCPVAERCGSCQWQWIDYPFQLEAKQRQVREALEHLGGFAEPPVEPVIAQPRPFGYRNKSTFPIGRDARGEPVIGYYQKDSHRIVPLNACPVQDSRLDPLLAAARELIRAQGWSIYDEKLHRGALRHLGLRIGERTGQRLLTFVVNGQTLSGIKPAAQALMDRFPDLVGVCLNTHTERGNTIFGPQTRCVAGQDCIEDVLDGFRFRIESTTFFQICTSQAEILARLVVRGAAATSEQTVIDAYCGIGTLSLPLARTARSVVGIESHVRSVEQARRNAWINGVENCRFKAGTVEALLPALKADIVVVDPPRKGCDPAVLAAILGSLRLRVVYVSCNPATLARDLRQLVAGGYRLVRVQPVDLFAQTHHVECVATLERP
ncbi:MAG: 23S rRNA (uracil(1939)-C(5))-methyltransferase RlmD [Aphanocapsa lilacina HA4352-LM1]|jgi:23S rRNA (uracil1939-C5)-methyltransferase|nr:23S rRNA (uracil(1939)-C(5))-methyltransferase RlmD [Aphanocapsa lilacina HA4352-LM1]